jgi:acylphosphatase
MHSEAATQPERFAAPIFQSSSLLAVTAGRKNRSLRESQSRQAHRKESGNATIFNLMAAPQIARRFFVTGTVQGVGFRYFTQDEAERLHLTGFVRNLRDGRVEVYAIGFEESLAQLRTLIARGPRGAMVRNVVEEPAAVDPRFAKEFSITYDS